MSINSSDLGVINEEHSSQSSVNIKDPKSPPDQIKPRNYKKASTFIEAKSAPEQIKPRNHKKV